MSLFCLREQTYNILCMWSADPILSGQAALLFYFCYFFHCFMYVDCKVVPSENVVTQHKLLILDVQIRRRFRKIKRKLDLKIKWRRLKEGNQGVFVDRVVHEVDGKPKMVPIQQGIKLLAALKELLKMYLVSHRVVLHHIRTYQVE